PLEDLVNEGNIGLIQAAQKFNPDKEVRFISYAVWYIRARISEYINNHSRLIRLPSNRLRQISKMNATLSEIEKGTSEVSSSEPDPDIYDYLKTLESTRIQSLDLSYGEEESLALIDTIQDSMFPDADELMDKDVLANKLEAILDTLPRQYKEVLIRLYGINRDERMTLDQIGKELGVSRQRIQQVSQRALKQLRANLPITLLEELNL
ncbi:MAG: sigma-70 family RNA polymerase sigma factor, partial [Bacteroidetes bacterium]|nr:sigma-70 family RNA polymerase sigma factor [Bacteroidota bacterium]